MKLSKELRDEKLEARKKAYYSLDSDLYSMREKMRYIDGFKGNSTACRMLVLAIDAMSDQVRKDFYRYEKRIKAADMGDDLILVQKALNREKTKNAILEKKIEEAKTSSGLFIDFVREKLNLN